MLPYSTALTSLPLGIQVVLSSSNHRLCGIEFDDLDLKKGGYQPFKAYGQSKTANVYMANEIDRRYGAKGVAYLHCLSTHAGY